MLELPSRGSCFWPATQALGIGVILSYLMAMGLVDARILHQGESAFGAFYLLAIPLCYILFRLIPGSWTVVYAATLGYGGWWMARRALRGAGPTMQLWVDSAFILAGILILAFLAFRIYKRRQPEV